MEFKLCWGVESDSASFLPVRVSSKREFQVQLDAACPDFSSVINPVLIPISDKNSVITDIKLRYNGYKTVTQ